MTQTDDGKIVIAIATEVKFNLGRGLGLAQLRSCEIKTQARINGIQVAVVGIITVFTVIIYAFILWIHIEQTIYRLDIVTGIVIQICTNLTVHLDTKILSDSHLSIGNQSDHQRKQ